MTEPKKGLREQAKTIKQRYEEYMASLLPTPLSVETLARQYDKFWECEVVSLGDVEEKVQGLRKLLENRPRGIPCLGVSKLDMQDQIVKTDEWFERFEREFEAVFGKEGLKRVKP